MMYHVSHPVSQEVQAKQQIKGIFAFFWDFHKYAETGDGSESFSTGGDGGDVAWYSPYKIC